MVAYECIHAGNVLEFESLTHIVLKSEEPAKLLLGTMSWHFQIVLLRIELLKRKSQVPSQVEKSHRLVRHQNFLWIPIYSTYILRHNNANELYWERLTQIMWEKRKVMLFESKLDYKYWPCALKLDEYLIWLIRN